MTVMTPCDTDTRARHSKGHDPKSLVCSNTVTNGHQCMLDCEQMRTCWCRGQDRTSAVDSPSWRTDMAARGVGSGPRAAGMSVYVGSVLADVQPMLSADLGILVDPEPDVLEALGLLGVRVDVLTTGAKCVKVRRTRQFVTAQGSFEERLG